MQIAYRLSRSIRQYLSAHLFFLKQGLVEQGLCSSGAIPKRPLSSGVRATDLMLFLGVSASGEQTGTRRTCLNRAGGGFNHARPRESDKQVRIPGLPPRKTHDKQHPKQKCIILPLAA